ncbi:MAG: amidohydrolase family protein [Thermoleophilia bacterium]
MLDLLVRNGTVVTAERTEALDVAVDGERIVAVGPTGSLGDEARRIVDAAGCLVMPGGVDPHVHYAMHFENILDTEGPEHSHAAACGGVTTVCDFAFQVPPQGLAEGIAEKLAEHEGRMAVDYGVHAILTKTFSYDVVDEIGQAIADGVPTIKTMLTYGYKVDDGQMYGAMVETGANGGMFLVHAEDDAIANWLTGKYLREGKRHGAYICEVRGPLVEEAATRRALLLAERAPVPLYVLHMAAGTAIEALAEYRSRGLPMYGETLLAYLSFTQDDLWDESPVQVGDRVFDARGALFNNYPTPKFAADRETCWQAIADGRLQAVSTDHALVSLADRFGVMSTTIDNMQAGQAAVELRLPVLWDRGVNGGRISANRFVELVSTNPAKIMGVWPRKGALEVGSDADMVVFDPARRWTVRWQDLHMSGEYSCWDGWELTGKVRDTILRGSVIVEDGEFVGSRTGGRYLKRALRPELLAGDPGFLAVAR